MKISIDEPKRLLLTDHPWFWSALCCLFVFTTVLSTYQMYLDDELSWFKAAALGLAIAGLLIGATLFSERTIIDVRQTQQSVEVSRKGFTGEKKHRLNFADINKVVLESSTSQNSMTTRIVLHAQDEVLPLTRAYSGNVDRNTEIAGRLRTILFPGREFGPDELLEDSLREMIVAGRSLQAIVHLADARQWPTARAKKYVDQLESEVEEAGGS